MVQTDEERKQSAKNSQRKFYSKKENNEKRNERQRKRRGENKESDKIKRTEYLAKPDVNERTKFVTSNRNRRYGIKNRETINKKNKQRFNQLDENQKKGKYSIRNNTRNKTTLDTRNSLIRILGGHVCKQCKFKDHRALDIEHINDTGHLDDKRFTDDRQRNSYYVKHPIEAIENLQVYCSSCNQSKKQNKVRKLSMTPKNIKSRTDYQQKRKLAVKILGGNICVNYDECKNSKYLEIDHIHNDGNKDRKKGNQGMKLFNIIINNPNESKKKYQILCSNCNKIKKDILEHGNCNCGLYHIDNFDIERK